MSPLAPGPRPSGPLHPGPTILALVLLAGSPAFAQGPRPTPVVVDAVLSETVQERRLVTGDLRAARRSAVAAREKGVVLELLFREGQSIEQDAVLARQDAKQLGLELGVLRAQVPSAEAAVREAASDVRRAETDLAALEKLVEREAANPKELSDARSTLAGAQARHARMQAELGVLDARIAQLEGRIADMEIRAPFAGTIAARRTEVGEWLDAGAAVAELVSTGTLEVWLEVPQQYLPGLGKQLADVRVVLDATGAELSVGDWRLVPDVTVSGRLFQLVGAAGEGTVAAPGMSVKAEVPTSERAERLTLSRDALLRNEAGAYVYLAMPGGDGQPSTAAPVQVEVLFYVGQRAAVRSPRLAAGARVVVEGNERLFPMAPIQPIEASASRTQEAGSGVRGGTGR